MEERGGRTQHGEEDPPGPEDVGEPVHHVGQELVRQALDRLVGVVEVDQQDLGVILQLGLPLQSVNNYCDEKTINQIVPPADEKISFKMVGT